MNAPQKSPGVKELNSWTLPQDVLSSVPEQLCTAIFKHSPGDPSTMMESSAGAAVSPSPTPSNAATHALMASQQSAANDAVFKQRA